MAYGQQIPGRYTRRRSSANVTASKRLRRFYPLISSTASAAGYGVNADNAATVASEYFWGAATPAADPVTFGVKVTVQSVQRAAVY